MKTIYLLLIILIATACDSDSTQDPVSQLPPATMTGENTFGFLLNGEPVNVRNTSNQFAIYQGGFLQFGAAGITLIIEDPFTENIEYNLVLNSTNISKVRFAKETENGLLCIYDYENTVNGSLVLTNIDEINLTISGTFEFSTINQDCENIDITEGRFDLQYIP